MKPLPLLLAAALSTATAVHAVEPLTAATVRDFVADCSKRPHDEMTAVCFSYIQGALDQITLRSSSAECAIAFDRPEQTMEVWTQLTRQAPTLAGTGALWRGVAAAAGQVAPACR